MYPPPILQYTDNIGCSYIGTAGSILWEYSKGYRCPTSLAWLNDLQTDERLRSLNSAVGLVLFHVSLWSVYHVIFERCCEKGIFWMGILHQESAIFLDNIAGISFTISNGRQMYEICSRRMCYRIRWKAHLFLNFVFYISYPTKHGGSAHPLQLQVLFSGLLISALSNAISVIFL